MADEIPQWSEWRRAGMTRIAGIDEVGRGPLAGPVVAAAVLLPANGVPPGLADSKALTAQRREKLAEALFACAEIGLATVLPAEIDRLNIHRATLLAMARALAALPRPAEAALVDGKFTPPGLAIPAAAVIGGDARVPAISAASIIAKVTRDAMMAAAAGRYPGYGFDRHAGYPAPAHKAALARLGLCPLHRLSYAPCRALSGDS
ncbi:MAG: ribonuclease HII [Rhabdaerophilum sp.]